MDWRDWVPSKMTPRAHAANKHWMQTLSAYYVSGDGLSTPRSDLGLVALWIHLLRPPGSSSASPLPCHSILSGALGEYKERKEEEEKICGRRTELGTVIRRISIPPLARHPPIRSNLSKPSGSLFPMHRDRGPRGVRTSVRTKPRGSSGSS